MALRFNSDFDLNHPRVVGWSGAAFGDRSGNGACRLGYMFGCCPPLWMDPATSCTGHAALLDEPPKTVREGGIYASSGTVDHVELLVAPRGQFGPTPRRL